MPLATYQKKNKKSQKKDLSKTLKIGVWALALVVTTLGLSASYTVFSQAFGSEDKATATEICRFGAKNVTSYEDMRTVTTTSGRHIFLQSKATYKDGSKDGLIAFKEIVSEDPCQGVLSLKTTFNGKQVTDLSVNSWELYDWDMTNAVFIPDVYSEKNDDGYIAVFLRERTGGYTKKLAVSLLQYSNGEIKFKKTTPLFSNNENFSTIVNAHYSYNTSTLYVFGTTQSEGVRGRGMHLASITHEDLLLGNQSYYYCNPGLSLQSQNSCNWTTEVKKSNATIATKTGEMDVLGLDDNLSLLLQNTGDKVMVYDLATSGAVWNPGLQLLDCTGTIKCDHISTYDYQMSMFENKQEKLKVMTFNFIQAYKGEAILYEAVIDDFTVGAANPIASLPSVSLKSAYAMIREDQASSKSTVGSSKVVEKTRSAPPKVESTKSKVERNKDDDYVAEKRAQKSVSDTVKAVVQRVKPEVTTTKKQKDDVATPSSQKKGKEVVVERIEQTIIARSSDTTVGVSGGKMGGAKTNTTVVRATSAPKNALNGMAVAARRGTTIANKGGGTGTATATPTTTRQVVYEVYDPSRIPTETPRQTPSTKPTQPLNRAPREADCKAPNQWICEDEYHQRDCTCLDSKGRTVTATATPTVVKTNVPLNTPSVTTLNLTYVSKNECPYGNILPTNEKFCKNNNQQCAVEGTGLDCRQESLRYAAFQKCISGNETLSCCPKGTHVENGKCVEYVDLEARDADGNKIERCKYGNIDPAEKKFCEAAIQKCDSSPAGDGLDCSSNSLKHPGYIKCRSMSDRIMTCCAPGSVNVGGTCKKGDWVYPENCYTNGKPDGKKCDLQKDGKYQYKD